MAISSSSAFSLHAKLGGLLVEVGALLTEVPLLLLQLTLRLASDSPKETLLLGQAETEKGLGAEYLGPDQH